MPSPRTSPSAERSADFPAAAFECPSPRLARTLDTSEQNSAARLPGSAGRSCTGDRRAVAPAACAARDPPGSPAPRPLPPRDALYDPLKLRRNSGAPASSGSCRGGPASEVSLDTGSNPVCALFASPEGRREKVSRTAKPWGELRTELCPPRCWSELGPQSPRTSIRASSTERSSSASRRPAERPSRSGSTTAVCSTRTRVS